MDALPTTAALTPRSGPAGDPDAPRTAWAQGLATCTQDGQVLEAWYPHPALGQPDAEADQPSLPEPAGPTETDQIRHVTRRRIRTQIHLDQAPADAADAYLRLHLLSHRLVRPHGLNLEQIFAILPNLAWTTLGPCQPEHLDEVRAYVRASGGWLGVASIDKFPRMSDYVTPSGVRIGDADRVRLGAYLSPGTTVMHEGFVNFNAGTLGTSMVEGRISAGVVVDDGSDIGGGASIMGTLSGGGKQVVSIGKNCLLGANAGLGISLGDDCVVESGCYLTSGSKVALLGVAPQGSPAPVVKARDLSGQPGWLFRRNSQTGALEAVPRRGKDGTILANWGGLNASLHTTS